MYSHFAEKKKKKVIFCMAYNEVACVGNMVYFNIIIITTFN